MRLLLCDDHQLFMQAVAHAFTANGHEVLATVTEPATAVTLAAEIRPDVCIMDLSFPDGDGMAAVTEILRAVPETKVLVLTASADPQTAWTVLRSRAHGLVGKDQPVEQIFRALEQLESGELAFDPSLLRDGMAGRGTPDFRLRLVRTLTPREREVLGRLVRAETTDEIAQSMNITVSTARSYVQGVLVKLGVHSRLQAVSLVTQLDIEV
jgi:two-component system nitrate/nitrite response regulator NarL